ncbi:MAG: V-type ATP synthase subunit A, partial [Clostridia bacterium]
PWFNEHVSRDFSHHRAQAMHLLQLESELQEIVRLVGIDALSPADRLTLETSQIIREDFLQQNAFADVDSYSSLDKQARL